MPDDLVDRTPRASPPGGSESLHKAKGLSRTMAGHKGYGLALMIEILSGVLSGFQPCATMSESGCASRWAGRTDHSHGRAVNPGRLPWGGAELLFARQDELFGGIRGHCRPCQGVDRIEIPGDIEQDKRRRAWQRAFSSRGRCCGCSVSPPRKTASRFPPFSGGAGRVARASWSQWRRCPSRFGPLEAH